MTVFVTQTKNYLAEQPNVIVMNWKFTSRLFKKYKINDCIFAPLGLLTYSLLSSFFAFCLTVKENLTNSSSKKPYFFPWNFVTLKQQLFLLALLFSSVALSAQIRYFNVNGGWAGNDANGNAIIKWEITVCVDGETSGVKVRVPTISGTGAGIANVASDEDAPWSVGCNPTTWRGDVQGRARDNRVPDDPASQNDEVTPNGGLTIDADGCAMLNWVTYSKDYDSDGQDEDHYVVANVISNAAGQTTDPGFDCTGADNNGNQGCEARNSTGNQASRAACINRIDCDDVSTNNYEQILGLAHEFIDTIRSDDGLSMEIIFAYVACHHGESDYVAGFDLVEPGNNNSVDIIPDTIVGIEITTNEWFVFGAEGGRFDYSFVLDSVRLENPGIQYLQAATDFAPFGTTIIHTEETDDQLLTNPTTSYLPMDASQNNQNGIDDGACGNFELQCDTIYLHSFYTFEFSAPSGEQCNDFTRLAANASGYSPKNGYQSTGDDDGIGEGAPNEQSTVGLNPDPEFGDCGATITTTCSAAPGEDCDRFPISICAIPPPSCTPPSNITFSQDAATCTTGTANDDGTINLASQTGGSHYGVSNLNATSYDGPTTINTATNIGALPEEIQSNIPNTGGSYFVRIFNSAATCFTDNMVTAMEVACITSTCDVVIQANSFSSCVAGAFDGTITLDWTDAPTTGNIEYSVNDGNFQALSPARSNLAANATGEVITIPNLTCNSTKKITLRFADAPDCYEELVFIFAPGDPAGHIYCEETGAIITGGTIAVTPPAGGSISVGSDGSNGHYYWLATGSPITAGIYTMSYTPPSGYTNSTTLPGNRTGDTDDICDPTFGSEDNPTNQDPLLMGMDTINGGATLSDFTAANNPFFLDFHIEQNDPFVDLNNIPLAGCTVMGPCTSTCSVIRDNFDNAAGSESYNNQDGNTNWTSNWIESGDDNNAANGDVQVNGNDELVFDHDDTSPPSVRRSLNIAGADIATLSVYYFFHSGTTFETDDRFVIEISNNNGTSYDILETIDNTFNQGQILSFDITSYIDSDVVLRLRVLSGFTGTDEFIYINQIEVVACNLSIAVTNTTDSYNTCATMGTGEIAVLGFNGEAPYEYSIDGTNFQSAEVFSGLLPGTFTLTVRDNQGRICTTTATVGTNTQTFNATCSISVAGADNVKEDNYIIDFVTDAPTITGGDGLATATITGNVLNAADNSDAGFDYNISAVVTGGPTTGTSGTVNFPYG